MQLRYCVVSDIESYRDTEVFKIAQKILSVILL